MQEAWDYVWDMESTEEDAGRVRYSLIRKREHHSSKHLIAHTETLERTVIFSRSFRPLLERAAAEH